uniref:asparagine--tRNA ligase n=1 Tax=Eutreptiella gymnastica TaxID=73025 RepID=A0A7S1JAC4_9EUGL
MSAVSYMAWDSTSTLTSAYTIAGHSQRSIPLISTRTSAAPPFTSVRPTMSTPRGLYTPDIARDRLSDGTGTTSLPHPGELHSTVNVNMESSRSNFVFATAMAIMGIGGVIIGRLSKTQKSAMPFVEVDLAGGSQESIAMCAYQSQIGRAQRAARSQRQSVTCASSLSDIQVPELTVEEKKAILMQGFGLNDKGATDALKNEELVDTLLRLNEKFGASKLIYAAATKGTTDEHRELLGQYIKEEKIKSANQLDSALNFLKEKPNVVFGDAEFEHETGVGIEVSEDDIVKYVSEIIESNKAEIVEDRYQFNVGLLLAALRKTDYIKWGDPQKMKAELDKQILALLGPKTAEDNAAGKKKKEKAKPAAEKPKKQSAADLAAQQEAEVKAALAKAAEDVLNSFLYKPRCARIQTMIDEASKGNIPDEKQDIKVAGWIRTLRDQVKFMFVELNDGSGPTGLQIVVTPEMCPGMEAFRETRAAYGACIEVTGVIVKSVGKGQLIEMQAKEIKVLGEVGEGFPLAKTALPVEVLRMYPHLRVRTNVMACVMRIRNAASFAIHKFFQERNFQYVHTPILTSNDCEGAGECFSVTSGALSEDMDWSKEFFASKAMLTVSGQLNVETYAAGLTNVYTFGPTFRAENSNTTRHLAEFWMVEPEMWFSDLDDLMNVAEDFLKYCIAYIMKECPAELLYLEQYHERVEKEQASEGKADARKYEGKLTERLMGIVAQPFGRVTYTEAIDLLKKEVESGRAQFAEPNIEWGMDMASEHERYLAEVMFKRPVIVTNYPAKIKSFYMKQSEDGSTVQGMDILCPTIGEIIGGSAREDNFDRLVALAKEKGMSDKDIESLSWYTDLRKYGSAPHGGFGLGFERLLLLCTGMLNIRDVIPFPRYPGNIQC